MTSLGELNQAIHEAFLSLWEQSLAALFALDHLLAQHHFQRLLAALEQHQHSEDLAFATIDAWPKGSAVVLLEAEHRKLSETGLEALALIERLASFKSESAQAQRVVLARYLDVLVRFKHLLEHHGGREQALSYPHLEAQLSPSLQQELRLAHEALLHSLEGSSGSPKDGSPSRN